MDGFGIRPGLLEMAETVARGGYLVLLPDLFYRAGRYQALVPRDVFAGGDVRALIGPLMASTDNLKAGDEDTQAFLDYLDTRRDVVAPLIGTVGFCMGGGMAITAAGSHPDRVAATVSFHGGNLATDDPKSPHLLNRQRASAPSSASPLVTNDGSKLSARDGGTPREGTDRCRRAPPCRDLSRCKARLDEARLPGSTTKRRPRAAGARCSRFSTASSRPA